MKRYILMSIFVGSLFFITIANASVNQQKIDVPYATSQYNPFLNEQIDLNNGIVDQTKSVFIYDEDALGYNTETPFGNDGEEFGAPPIQRIFVNPPTKLSIGDDATIWVFMAGLFSIITFLRMKLK